MDVAVYGKKAVGKSKETRSRKQNPAAVRLFTTNGTGRLLHQNKQKRPAQLDVATGTWKAQPAVVQTYPSSRLVVTAEPLVAAD